MYTGVALLAEPRPNSSELPDSTVTVLADPPGRLVARNGDAPVPR